MDAKLTLDDAKRRAQQREAVSGQQGMIQEKSDPDAKVEHINGRKSPIMRFKGRGPQKNRGRPKLNFSPTAGSRPKCTLCGRGKHSSGVSCSRSCVPFVQKARTFPVSVLSCTITAVPRWYSSFKRRFRRRRHYLSQHYWYYRLCYR